MSMIQRRRAAALRGKVMAQVVHQFLHLVQPQVFRSPGFNFSLDKQ